MTRHELVVVGAGFAGAATAWHLARAGATDVVLLDREPAAGLHSSGRNAALVRERVDHPLWQALTTEGARPIRSGELAPFRRGGSMLLGLGEPGSDRDVSELVPPARGRGLWCPDDGIVDVPAMLAGYLAGRDVRWDTRLLSYQRDGDGLRLATSRGEVWTRRLVNAAGPWGGVVGALPMVPTNRTLFLTEPRPDVDPSWPFVWDVRRGIYFRPEGGGLLLCACDEVPAAPGDYREDPALPGVLRARARESQPALGDLRIAYRWVGQRVFAPDRLPVVGFDPREPRLFHVAGLGGHGVTASFAIGALAADLLLGRRRGENPYGPERVLAAGEPGALAPAVLQ
jgi:glycine/D-amino acid oxidase-like deaminating enzyme